MGARGSRREAVQAWIRLKPTDPARDAVSAADTEAFTRALVKRVTERVGDQAQSVKVLPNLGCFIVSASPAFMRELAQQPEVESARPTDQPLTLIRPVKSRAVTIARAKRRAPRRGSAKKRPGK